MEFKAISQAEQEAKTIMWEALERMFVEGFISTETDIGASRWERTLKIAVKDTDTLDFRNFRIRGKLIQDLPYTYRKLVALLEGICGADRYEIKMDVAECEIVIKVALRSKQYRDEVEKMADEMIPANMYLVVTLMYNTHRIIKNAQKTHLQLAEFTHAQIKEQPFD